MDTNPAPAIEIFRTGTHTAMDGRQLTFSQADLDDLVASYDAAAFPAPIVVGHPTIDAPAYGWVASLGRTGATAFAMPDQVEPQFAEMVNAGRFKKVSASIYSPDTPGNPKPGHFYLKHVGFLGAAAPGVQGLKTVQFASGDQAAVLEFALPEPAQQGVGSKFAAMLRAMRDHFIKRGDTDFAGVLPDDALASLESSSAATVSTPAASFSAPESSDMPQPAEFAERESAISQKEADLAAREATIKAQEAKARRAGAAEFAEGLVAGGKILPREKAGVVELLVNLSTSTPLQFASEGEGQVTKGGAEVLRDLLSGLPQRIEYGRERSADPGASPLANFAAPPGVQVDTGRLELHQQALAMQAKTPGLGYIDAVRACGG